MPRLVSPITAPKSRSFDRLPFRPPPEHMDRWRRWGGWRSRAGRTFGALAFPTIGFMSMVAYSTI